MLRRCAFLTLADPGDYIIDDEHAYEPLRHLGWQVEAVPWSQPEVSWQHYDMVVIRSPWDYTHEVDRFLEVLAEVDRRTWLENSLSLVRWNLVKTYLRDLATQGVSIVPTLWRDRLNIGDLERLFAEVGCEEMVIKPVVGASAEGVYRLDASSARQQASEIDAYYADRAFQAQPLVHSVVEEGEYSLMYFNGEHSHTILKTPKPADFRTQEEHGAEIRAVPTGKALHAAGRKVLDALDEVPLYVRADFVRANGSDDYWLMELELAEPSLYLRMTPEAPAKFARALDQRFADCRGPGG